MFLRPLASLTYSMKSAVFGSRGSSVRRSSTRNAEEAGTKCTLSPSSVAAGFPSRSCRVSEEGAVARAFSTVARG